MNPRRSRNVLPRARLGGSDRHVAESLRDSDSLWKRLIKTRDYLSQGRHHITRRVEYADRRFAITVHKRPRFRRQPSAPSECETEDTNQPETTRNVPPFQTG
jgi:hypothetical protein